MLDLTQRQLDILVRIVGRFNATGEPVGSSTVAREEGIDVSSATVRNVMAELEKLGVLCQPHRSAGRMPTHSGMRLYVDHLVTSGELSRGREGSFEERFERLGGADVESTVRAAGLVVSELSRLTSVISSPEAEEIELKDIHLSQLSEVRVLVILVTRDGRVFDRAVQLEEPIDPDSLERMQNFLSEQVVGLSLRQVRRRIHHQLKAEEVKYRKFVRQALEMSEQVLDMATKSELFVEGTIHILDATELAQDIARARAVMRRLEDRERVLEVLERVCETPVASTLIGPELGEEWGEDLSLVACGYFQDGRQVGMVGIFGPMRMNYTRMIPLVERVAGMLSKELDDLA